MKKRIMGIVLLSTLLLSACSNGKDKEAETANSKVEQLESRVKELESSSSYEEKEENKATEIVNVFKEKGLPVFDDSVVSKAKLDADYPGIESQVTFYSTEKSEAEREIPDILSVTFCKDDEIKNSIIESTNKLNEAADDDYLSVVYVVNDKNNSILKAGKAISDEDFNKYKEVFENFE